MGREKVVRKKRNKSEIRVPVCKLNSGNAPPVHVPSPFKWILFLSQRMHLTIHGINSLVLLGQVFCLVTNTPRIISSFCKLCGLGSKAHLMQVSHLLILLNSFLYYIVSAQPFYLLNVALFKLFFLMALLYLILWPVHLPLFYGQCYWREIGEPFKTSLALLMKLLKWLASLQF